MIDTIAFDADDTLWHNERIFIRTKEKYTALLARYHDADWIEERLDETEVRNIKHFGYGVKGFTLSMIETAVELTEGRVKGDEIRDIISFAREMLNAPVEILDGVEKTVEKLKGKYRLMLITKGDLFDQEAKIARSGLGEFFSEVEILSNKLPEAYERVFTKYSIDRERFLMVGNSLRSDVVPVLSLGGNAVHIPYETEWWHERVPDGELEGLEIPRIGSISELPELVSELSQD